MTKTQLPLFIVKYKKVNLEVQSIIAPTKIKHQLNQMKIKTKVKVIMVLFGNNLKIIITEKARHNQIGANIVKRGQMTILHYL